jgi:hypothetical protein
MSGNLYDRPIDGEFGYLCSGNGTEENMESCLGLAPLLGGDWAIAGNKPEDAGHELRGSAAELHGLVDLIRQTVPRPDSMA